MPPARAAYEGYLTTRSNTLEKVQSPRSGTPQESGNHQGDGRGYDLIINYLAQLGVEYVFGVPGGAIEPLYNALARSGRRGGPRAVVARHETGAAFMADGYARESGRLGVCCATTGPGATNLITGVASAYQNEIPLLVLTGQGARPTFGRGAFQESSCTGINTLGMFAHCTRYNTLVSHIGQLEGKLVTAIMTAVRRRGPVHLTLPVDLARDPLATCRPAYNILPLLAARPTYDPAAVDVLTEQVRGARRIVVLIGGGCAEAMAPILACAEHMDATIVTTPKGKGLMNPYHPRYRGVFGFAGHASARQTLADPAVDLVLAAGSGFGEWESNGWDTMALLNQRLVHVDETEDHFTHSPMAGAQIFGRIKLIFESLLARLAPVSGRPLTGAPAVAASSAVGWFERVVYPPVRLALDDMDKCWEDSGPIKPQRLMSELSRMFPFHARFMADSTNGLLWAIHYLHPLDRRISGERPARRNIFSAGWDFASMGWAIGAAVGAALADRRSPVVCVTGDGSFLMSGQEITVAAKEGLTVIYVVLNDRALGTVKHGQRLAGAEPIGFELPVVDFCAMAQAMGIQAHRVRTPQDLMDLDVDRMCRHPGPTLLDVSIDPDEAPPLGGRMRALAVGE
jgi:acetolactate synthase-1/2/3 large subunit